MNVRIFIFCSLFVHCLSYEKFYCRDIEVIPPTLTMTCFQSKNDSFTEKIGAIDIESISMTILIRDDAYFYGGLIKESVHKKSIRFLGRYYYNTWELIFTEMDYEKTLYGITVPGLECDHIAFIEYMYDRCPNSVDDNSFLNIVKHHPMKIWNENYHFYDHRSDFDIDGCIS